MQAVDERRQPQVLCIDQQRRVERSRSIADLAAGNPTVRVVVVPVVVGIVVEALRLIVGLRADAYGDLVAELLIDDADETVLFDIERVHVADIAAVLELRLREDDVHDAEFGVATVQRALRAFEDFDALQIEVVERLEVAPAERAAAGVGAVDEEADARIRAGGTGRARAAHGDLRQVFARDIVEAHAGYCVQQVAAPHDRPFRLELIRSHGGDRARHVANAFFASPRSHDDGLETLEFRVIGLRRWVRLSESRRRNDEREDGCRGKKSGHVSPYWRSRSSLVGLLHPID